jgi:hypothetical protein
MKHARNRIAESYKWTAFMKLQGQTYVRSKKEIMYEFEGFVQSLRGAGVDYKIVVMVQGRTPRHIQHCEHVAKATKAGIARDGSGA